MAPIFIKFDGIEGEASQVDRRWDQLGDGLEDLGDGFARLVQDGTLAPSPVVELKHDDAVITSDFHKIGLDYLKVEAAQHKIDATEIVIAKTLDKSSPTLFSDTGGPPPLASDLQAYEADLKLTGLDFIKLASDLKGGAPAETISLDFNSIKIDYQKQSDDALKIGDDFIKLSAVAGDLKLNGLSDAFLKYGEDTVKLGNDDLKISTDFQKISADFSSQTFGGAISTELKFNQVVLQNPDDFIKLAGDLKLLDADLLAVGDDTHKIADAVADHVHKFASFEAEADIVARDLRRLGDGAVDLGGGFLKLINDGTPTDSSAPVPAELKYDDAIISRDFLKVGFDYLKAEAAQHKVDVREIVIVKQIDVSSPSLFASATGDGGGAAPALASDFLKYEADLKFTGVDFLKLSSDLKADSPAETFSLDYNSIKIDYQKQGNDALGIGDDFIKLSAVAGDLKLSGLADAFLKYGDDMVKLGNEDLKLSADFQKISQDFSSQTFGGAISTELKFNQVVLQNPDDFIKLAGDLKLLNADFIAVGGDTHKIAEAVEPSAQTILFKLSG
jgi:type VI protein secretion system component Hcp